LVLGEGNVAAVVKVLFRYYLAVSDAQVVDAPT
jgi:hypothetical protein